MESTFQRAIDIVHVPSLYYLMKFPSCGQSDLLKSISQIHLRKDLDFGPPVWSGELVYKY